MLDQRDEPSSQRSVPAEFGFCVILLVPIQGGSRGVTAANLLSKIARTPIAGLALSSVARLGKTGFVPLRYAMRTAEILAAELGDGPSTFVADVSLDEDGRQGRLACDLRYEEYRHLFFTSRSLVNDRLALTHVARAMSMRCSMLGRVRAPSLMLLRRLERYGYMRSSRFRVSPPCCGQTPRAITGAQRSASTRNSLVRRTERHRFSFCGLIPKARLSPRER